MEKRKKMETGTIKKEINWQKVFGSNPCMKNRKEIWFFNELGKQISLTRIIKVKIGEGEYILNYYDSEEVEELQIKNNRSLSLLELKYNKQTKKGLKKVNYNFYKVICYFLFEFFSNRLEKDEDFQSIMKELQKSH